MSDTFYKLTNDILFKRTFGNPKRSNLLICLINALLKLEGQDKITEVEILNPFNDKDFIGDKLSILDVKAQDERGVLYNIEMQVQSTKDWKKRTFYYASKLYSSQLKNSASYEQLNKTISISILDNICFPDNKELHNLYKFHNSKTLEPLENLIEMHFIEIPKFNEASPGALSSPFEKWLYTFKFGDLYQKESDMIPKELLTENGIEEAIQSMQYANSDRHLRELIESRQKFIHDQISAKEWAEKEGRKEGKKEAMKDIAIKLIDKGIMTNQDISDITGLEPSQIQDLRG
ncbi:MAG: hypothetical protein COB02_16025 [Candidatus Cloacimonadota bacterium]|nr:MAG: hypothetical protein COB02_16025 [Candidatus Cloacimonadota bacterium]